MKILSKCMAVMTCLFGVASVVAQATDDYPTVPYYRSAVMTVKGGAQTWKTQVDGKQSSTRAMEVQQALARHLQAVMKKDLVLDTSIKLKSDATFEVTLELAETAAPILFPKGIEVFSIGKSCDYNTAITFTGTPEAIAKLKEAKSDERKAAELQSLYFAQYAHWMPVMKMGGESAVVEVVDETKTSITFDVKFATQVIEQRQKAFQISLKAKQAAMKDLGI